MTIPSVYPITYDPALLKLLKLLLFKNAFLVSWTIYHRM
jgi:hypothetical protein